MFRPNRKHTIAKIYEDRAIGLRVVFGVMGLIGSYALFLIGDFFFHGIVGH